MQKKSIYKYASETGIPAGLYLTIMSACLLLSVKVPGLIILLLPLAIGFPFLLWMLMKKIVKSEPSYNKFSTLWLGGIYTVIFGSLICMFLSSLYVVFVEPGFVHLYISNAIEAAESTTMASDYSTTIAMMKEAMAAHLLPTGLEFLTTMAWFTCFSGSILSLLLSLIMLRTGRKVTRQFPV